MSNIDGSPLYRSGLELLEVDWKWIRTTGSEPEVDYNYWKGIRSTRSGLDVDKEVGIRSTGSRLEVDMNCWK